tara:strand:+ start:1308 stop:1955 length:648 start_codon:yes stop_codon:yes gene_type:complete
MKKELVISVFDKDLSWVDNVSKEVSIKKYRKGSNLNLDDEIYLSNNVGRDVHTFFYHILNNYDNLADITFFSQDYPFDHVENYVEIINSDVDFITKCSILHFDGYWGFHWNNIGTMWQLNPSSQFTNGRILTSFNDGYPHDKNLYVDETWKSLFNCPHPLSYDFVPGGHFCVTKETVKIRTKEFYQHVVTLLETYDKMPWNIERLEAYIFNKNYI